MIIKTQLFDQTLNYDLSQLSIFTRKSLRIKGSYIVTDLNQYITDIDIESLVTFDNKFLDVLYQKLNTLNDSKFILTSISCGIYSDFVVPWTITDDGGCDYNPEKTLEWFMDFRTKNLVPDELCESIKEKLFSDKISLKDLVLVSDIMRKYSSIQWSLSELKAKYKFYKGKRYNLIDEIKSNIFLIKLVYIYQRDACMIDYTCADKQYRHKIVHGSMDIYYKKYWYSVLKSYRWWLGDNDRKECVRFMSGVALQKAAISQIITIETIIKINKYDYLANKLIEALDTFLKTNGFYIEGASFEVIKKSLFDYINKYAETKVQYYLERLKPEYKLLSEIRYNRGMENTDVDKDIIMSRISNGTKCPFFNIDIEEYKFVYEFAKRIIFDPLLLINCFELASKKYQLSISEIIKIIIPTSDIIIKKEGNQCNLYINNELIDSDNIENIKRLQSIAMTV